MKRFLFLLVVVIFITSCVTAVKMPQNVTISDEIIDSIWFDYPLQNNEISAFKMTKICIADNLTNEEVMLSDSSKSFVGSYTGNLYTINSEKQIEGGQVIRMYDEDIKTVVARGSHKYNKTVGFLPMNFYLRYTVKINIKNNKLLIKYSNIERAQSDTGYASNSGFNPIGQWPGARPEEVYNELEMLSKKMNNCIN